MYDFMVKKKRLHTCNGKMQSVVTEPQKKYFPLILLLYRLQTLETSELSSFTWCTWFLSVALLATLAKTLLAKTLLTQILLT